MGISEPVLEEEGSLIAGWRAKFGEENHQVFVVIVLVVVAVVVDITVVVDTAVVVADTVYNNKINPYYRRTVLSLTSSWEQAGLAVSSMVSIGGPLRHLLFVFQFFSADIFYCVLINHRTFPGMPWAFRTVLFQFLLAQIFVCLYTNQSLNLSRYALDARLAIAITANFVNNW